MMTLTLTSDSDDYQDVQPSISKNCDLKNRVKEQRIQHFEKLLSETEKINTQKKQPAILNLKLTSKKAAKNKAKVAKKSKKQKKGILFICLSPYFLKQLNF